MAADPISIITKCDYVSLGGKFSALALLSTHMSVGFRDVYFTR